MVSDDALEVKLLFFDTFLHAQQELNLDLVQFPDPVYVKEIRVIPLGAKVSHGDLCGGNIMGATNPSKFSLEFFVNDLINPGASTFEPLGTLQYDEQSCIILRCENEIPTDGLVLRGLYSAVTLAVLGNRANIQVETPKIPDAELPETTDSSGIQTTPTIATSPSAAETSQSTPIEVDQSHVVEIFADLDEPRRDLDLPKSELDSRDSCAKDFCREVASSVKPDCQLSPDPGLRVEDDDDDDRVFSDKARNRSRSNSVDAGHGRSSVSIKLSGSQHRRDSIHSRSSYRRLSRSSPRRRRGSGTDEEQRSRSAYRSSGSEDEPASTTIDEGPAAALVVSRSPRDASPKHDIDSPNCNPASSLVPDSGPAPLSSSYQDFEEIISDDDLPEEMGEHDVDHNQKDEELTGLKVFDPMAGVEFQPLICIPDPSLTEGELETRKLLLLQAFEEPRDAEEEFEADERLPDAAKKVSQLVVNLPEPESSSVWVNSVEEVIPLLPKAVAQLMHMGRTSGILDVLLSWAEFGTDFDAALEQVDCNYVLRHLKAGIRLCSGICSCSPAIASRLLQRRIQHRLLNLYEQDHMSVPMKLLILQAVDKTLDLKLGFDLAVREVRHGRKRGASGKRSESEPDIDDDDDMSDVDDTGSDPTLYERLCRFVLSSRGSSRLRVAVVRLLNKFHFWELLETLGKEIEDLLGTDSRKQKAEEILQILEEILRVYRRAGVNLGQPGQQLPATRQLRVPPPVGDPYRGVFSALQTYSLLEVLLILACVPGRGEEARKAKVCRFLDDFSASLKGLAFLSANGELLAAILRAVMPKPPGGIAGDDERSPDAGSQSGEITGGRFAQMLGVQIIYYLQALKLVDMLFRHLACAVPQKTDLDPDSEVSRSASPVRKRLDTEELVETMKDLYGLTFQPAGKCGVAHVLGLERNLDAILPFLAINTVSPACRGYALGLLQCALQGNDSADIFLRYGGCEPESLCCTLEALADAVVREKEADLVDPATGTRKSIYTSVGYASQAHFSYIETTISDLLALLEPVRNPLSLDPETGVVILCDIVAKQISQIQFDSEVPPPFPFALLTSLRVLRTMAIPWDVSCGDGVDSEEEKQEDADLRFDAAMIAMFSADLMSSLKTLLIRLSDFYVQPTASLRLFGGSSPVALASLLDVSVALFHRLTVAVIDALNEDFKDLTLAPVFLSSYSLAVALGAGQNAVLCVERAVRRVQRRCLDALAAHLRPRLRSTRTVSVSGDGKEEDGGGGGGVCHAGAGGVGAGGEDASAAGKSLWTNVLKRVFEHLQTGPHLWLSGVRVLSALLPLPLPLQVPKGTRVSEEEAEECERQRKLWCAHVCCLGEKPFAVLQVLPRSSSLTLSATLKRIVTQLAELGAPIAIVVARSLLVGAACCLDDGVDASAVRCLSFLASVLGVATVKAAVLFVIDG
ncbi:unnamed protein product [Notodromas monacha]|uniref:Virilizer N-terminal domain-containing protein n=1 Tax=Notodromas monacha TaxID=399045 RepID=A0A7R9GHQ4_9CRUS|nr:unnamed protein product [Notodromas monacha]CAG0921600.1 unnamed protein product [Notodromas monacha]